MIAGGVRATLRLELLLMRHAEPVEYADGGDAERALRPSGLAQAAAVGRALQRLGLPPHAALSSPLLRARQTARAVVDAAGATAASIPTDPRLLPTASPHATVEAMRAAAASLPGTPRLLAVGHNPSISATLGWLASGGSDTRTFCASTGDLAHLHLEFGNHGVRAVVLAWLPSAALQRLLDG